MKQYEFVAKDNNVGGIPARDLDEAEVKAFTQNERYLLDASIKLGFHVLSADFKPSGKPVKAAEKAVEGDKTPEGETPAGETPENDDEASKAQAELQAELGSDGNKAE